MHLAAKSHVDCSIDMPSDFIETNITNRGYDADWFRDKLINIGITPCILTRKSGRRSVKYDKRRNRIEIMFGRLKDWRRVATSYDRCPKVFLSAIALATTVLILVRSPEPRDKTILSSYKYSFAERANPR